ncbi:MAG: aldehyde dehydrogenase family protein [Acidobacteriota bacterium]
MQEYGLYIDGQWLLSSNGEIFETKNPATGEVLATFPKATEENVNKAVEAAKKAFPKWRETPAPKRAEILFKAAHIMEERKNELGALLTSEMGKIIAEGKGDVQEGIDLTKYVAGEGRRLMGETVKSELPDKFAMTVRQPIGVVGLITPWNFPFAIPCWKIMPALVAGNAIVFKPATDTPLIAAKLIEILIESGIPEGVINFITGSGSVAGEAIVHHPDVKAISLTGSVEVGRHTYVEAAKRLARVELELGGKNPQIILEDADIDLAVDGVLFGAFGTAGQRCTATSRLIIQGKVYDQVMEKLITRTKKLKIGNPLDPEIDIGPLINESQGRQIMEYIKIGQEEGARLLTGGKRLTGGIFDKGFYIEPTIFEAKHGMRITKEEIFGPVLALIKVRDFEEAIFVANDVEYGLSSSIYTKNINLAFKAIELLEAGITYINAPTIGAEVQLPFGGVKDSGNGGREAGSTAIDEFTEIKTVFIDYSSKLQKAQIEEGK